MRTLPAVEMPVVHGLDAAELASFRANGYLLKRGLFSRQRIAELSREIDGLHESMHAHAPDTVWVSWEEGLAADRPPRIRQLMNSERVSPVLDAMSRSEEILAVMRVLIGPDIHLFHSKLMMKAAKDGTFTPWHQDWGYWQHQSLVPSQVNCMLAIDEADEANGAIRFVDGSHLQGAVTHDHIPSTSFSIGLNGDLDRYPQATLLEMLPGDAVFFGPLVIHGSGPNTSARDRRANTFAYDQPMNEKREQLGPHMHREGRRNS